MEPVPQEVPAPARHGPKLYQSEPYVVATGDLDRPIIIGEFNTDGFVGIEDVTPCLGTGTLDRRRRRCQAWSLNQYLLCD